MRNNIPLSKPDIREEDIEAVVSVLRSGMLVQGELVAALEDLIKTLINVPQCCAVSNGTASLHLALVALGVGPGDEVIIPAFSYIATANVVELVGARCRFVDIDDKTFTIDVTRIEEAISPKTKAIIPVHEFGICADMFALMEKASKHNLFVIEDAACALGAKQQDRMAGSFGHFGSFSLHPRKAITSGEGGLLTTHSQPLDYRVRTLRNHGIAPGSYPMDFVEAGFNYRMTDFQAALAGSQFKRLHQIIFHKETLAALYIAGIKSDYLKLPVVPFDRKHTWQTFHVMVDQASNREKLMNYLKKNGISTNYGAQCIPAMTYYQNKYQLSVPEVFPNAWAAYTRGLALPIYEQLTSDQVLSIIELLNNYNFSC